MRRFMNPKNRTPEYDAAVTALGRLALDLADRAFAEAVCEARVEAWAERYGLKRSEGHPCIARLVGKRCGDRDWWRQAGWERKDDVPPCRPPGTDHADLWLKDGKPVAYTSQPYGLSSDTLRELLVFCDRWGLEFHISAWPAGHFPGSVLWVEITPKGKPLWEKESARR